MKWPHRPFNNEIETERLAVANIGVLEKKSILEGEYGLSDVGGQMINSILLTAISYAKGI